LRRALEKELTHFVITPRSEAQPDAHVFDVEVSDLSRWFNELKFFEHGGYSS
jgi:hypothetical protein